MDPHTRKVRNVDYLYDLLSQASNPWFLNRLNYSNLMNYVYPEYYLNERQNIVDLSLFKIENEKEDNYSS